MRGSIRAVRPRHHRVCRAATARISASRAPTRSSRCSRARRCCATSCCRCSACRRCAGIRSSRLDRQRELVAQRAARRWQRVGLDASRRSAARRRPPMASAGASRSPWRWRRSRSVLLLDEPFAGLSIEERRDVQKLLIAIPRDVTIVMIEHDMDVALDFAERITVMHFGEVVVEGTRAEVVAASAHAGDLSWRVTRCALERYRRLLRRQPRAAGRFVRASARAGCSACSGATAPANRPA